MEINQLHPEAPLVMLSSITTSTTMASSNPEINIVSADYLVEDFVADQIPEQLKDDCLVGYFRCRYKNRDALKSTYDELQQGRIDREITRISNLRRGFEETERNKPDIELFKYRQALWRMHAISNREANLKDVKERVEEMVKSKKSKLKEEDRSRRVDFEKEILVAVNKWRQPRSLLLTKPKTIQDAEESEEKAVERAKDPLKYLIVKVAKKWKGEEKKHKRPTLETRETIDTSRICEHPEDSYGISVHKMTLRRSDPTCPSSYMKYDTERYPLSEILVANEMNPLTVDCEPNTIRYFHFPANNMHWIEVRLPNSLNYYTDHV